MTRRLAALLLALFLCSPHAACAQQGTPASPTPQGEQGSGLTLTPPQQLDFRPGKLITVQAKGSEKVSWDVTVYPDGDADYVARDDTLVLAMPAPGTTVLVVAAGIVGGKPVVAKTTITIKGLAKDSTANPRDTPAKAPSGPVKHVTLVLDGSALTDPQKALAASQALRDAVTARGAKLRVLDVRSTSPATKDILPTFQPFFDAAKGPCVVLQDSEGNPLPGGQAYRLVAGPDGPDNEKQLLALIDQINSAK